MKHNRVIALVLAGVAAVTAASASAELTTNRMKTQESVEYPAAGIALAVPTGFTIAQQLGGEYQVMTATRTEGRLATQFISLTAYPVDGKTTCESLLASLRQPLQESLAVRKLKVEKTVEIFVAGLKGQAVHMSYTFRGIKTVTLSACFIREIDPPAAKAGEIQPVKKRLAYVLTLEVAEDHRKTMLKTFEAILRTIMFTPIRRPIDCPIDFDGAYLRNWPQGYALRIPVGWTGGQNELGLFTEQADYTLGGLPCPSVQVVASNIPPDLTAQACGEKVFQFMRKQGTTVQILSQAPAKLAKRDGYQFVIRKAQAPASQPAKTQPADTAPPASTLEVHRLVCVPPNEELYEEKAWNYALIVAGTDVTVEQLTNLADRLAERFIVMPAREE